MFSILSLLHHMFFIPLTVYIFGIYMFINRRQWHFENKTFHLFNKYLLGTFRMLVATLGVRNITVNEAASLVSLEA